MRLIPSNLASLSKCVAGIDTKYAITNVRFKEEDGGYRVEATDTRILAVVTGKDHPDKDTAVGIIDALAGQPNGGTECLVNSKEWADILKLTPARRKAASANGIHALTGIVVSQSHDKDTSPVVSVSATDGNGSCHLRTIRGRTGRFPPIDLIQPKNKITSRVTLCISALMKLLEAAHRIAGENDSVTLEIHENRKNTFGNGEQPVRLLAQPNDKTQLFSALIMPLVSAGEHVDPLKKPK